MGESDSSHHVAPAAPKAAGPAEPSPLTPSTATSNGSPALPRSSRAVSRTAIRAARSSGVSSMDAPSGPMATTIQPSQRAARRMPPGFIAPSQMGGRGCWSGRGPSTNPCATRSGPSCSSRSPRSPPSTMASASSMRPIRATRSKSSPKPVKSASSSPAPSPSTSRPSLARSSVAAAWTTSCGRRRASAMIEVMRRSRVVAAATAVRVTKGSAATLSMDVPRLSQMDRPCQPLSSAARARRTTARGSASSPSGQMSMACRIWDMHAAYRVGGAAAGPVSGGACRTGRLWRSCARRADLSRPSVGTARWRGSGGPSRRGS